MTTQEKPFEQRILSRQVGDDNRMAIIVDTATDEWIAPNLRLRRYPTYYARPEEGPFKSDRLPVLIEERETDESQWTKSGPIRNARRQITRQYFNPPLHAEIVSVPSEEYASGFVDVLRFTE